MITPFLPVTQGRLCHHLEERLKDTKLRLPSMIHQLARKIYFQNGHSFAWHLHAYNAGLVMTCYFLSYKIVQKI